MRPRATVVIAGSSGDRGAAIIEAFASDRWTVVVPSTGDVELADRRRTAGVEVVRFDPAAADGFARGVEDRFGAVGVLVNHLAEAPARPGQPVRARGAGAALPEDLVALVAISWAFVPFMTERGDGQIVNVATVASARPPRTGPAPKSRTPLASLTDAMRAGLAPSGIRVQAVTCGRGVPPAAMAEAVRRLVGAAGGCGSSHPRMRACPSWRRPRRPRPLRP